MLADTIGVIHIMIVLFVLTGVPLVYFGSVASSSRPDLSNAGSMQSSFTTPPTWVFTVAYVAFAALVIITGITVPPTLGKHKR
jgi:hypothetical protein